MAIDDARSQLAGRWFAPVDVELFVELGAPADAFHNGYLDVDRLIDIGWTFDDDESLQPPRATWDGVVHPDPTTPVPGNGGYIPPGD